MLVYSKRRIEAVLEIKQSMMDTAEYDGKVSGAGM